MLGECNYGGRVTDDKDRRILTALMNDFFGEQLLAPGFYFANNRDYPVPPKGKYSDYIEFINKLPNNQPASLFGFHENAMIARDLKETDELCNALLLISNSSGKSVQTASGSG